ncbi:MAG: hypothetical protein EOM65_04870 [Synergistales bacterium]|nr:hypothetical protein [Synergistales bacterium]
MASDDHYDREYGCGHKVVSLCDESHLKGCAVRALVNESVSRPAAIVQAEMLAESGLLQTVCMRLSGGKPDADSAIDELTFHIETRYLNEVTEY